MPNKKKQSLPPTRIRLLRWVIAGLGVCGIIYGICYEGVAAVIANAIALCMSCIGLG